MVYNAIKQVILDQIETAVLGETLNDHFEQHFEAGRAAEALGKRSLRKDKFLSPIP